MPFGVFFDLYSLRAARLSMCLSGSVAWPRARGDGHGRHQRSQNGIHRFRAFENVGHIGV
jgi:hypothetical protein